MIYLIKATEVFRADTEKEAQALIDAAKKDNTFELKKYSSETKVERVDGEIVNTYFKVSMDKVYDDLKSPQTDGIILDENIEKEEF